MSSRMDALNWMQGTDQDRRMAFVKQILSCCSLDELKIVQKLTNTAQKAKRPQARLQQRLRRQGLAVPAGTAAAESAPASASAAPASAPSASSSPVPSSSASTAEKEGYWWEDFGERDMFSFDTEMVDLYERDEFGKHKKAPGTVAVSDFEGNIVLSEKVFHKPGSFITDSAHIRISGFRRNDLADGKPFEEVKSSLLEYMEESLVITQAGWGDFKVFGLNPGEYNNFDLQSKFQQHCGEDKYGNVIMQPISLRRLVLHFFDEDIQAGSHSAEKDAIYTMKLFKVYQNLAKKRGLKKRSDEFSFDEFDNVKKIV